MTATLTTITVEHCIYCKWRDTDGMMLTKWAKHGKLHLPPSVMTTEGWSLQWCFGHHCMVSSVSYLTPFYRSSTHQIIIKVLTCIHKTEAIKTTLPVTPQTPLLYCLHSYHQHPQQNLQVTDEFWHKITMQHELNMTGYIQLCSHNCHNSTCRNALLLTNEIGCGWAETSSHQVACSMPVTRLSEVNENFVQELNDQYQPQQVINGML